MATQCPLPTDGEPFRDALAERLAAARAAYRRLDEQVDLLHAVIGCGASDEALLAQHHRIGHCLDRFAGGFNAMCKLVGGHSAAVQKRIVSNG